MARGRSAAAATAGLGLLPEHVVRQALRDGPLARILPGWHAEDGTVQLAFNTRRGRPPAARAFIDQRAERFREDPPIVAGMRGHRFRTGFETASD